jgi:hypothetical protein
VVVASGDSKSDGHAGFGLCSFSLLLLMLYLEMTKIMAMKACYAGGAVALASVFSLLSTVSFLWFSLPCLSLVSSSSPFFFHSDERIKERTPLFPCYPHYPLFSLSFPFFIFMLSPFPAPFFVFSVLFPFFFFRLSFSVFSPSSRSSEGAYT